MTTIKTLTADGARFFAGIGRKGKINWTGYRHLANEFKTPEKALEGAKVLQESYKVETPLTVVTDAKEPKKWRNRKTL